MVLCKFLYHVFNNTFFFSSFTVILFCMAALIFPIGFYINEVGGQPYKLPNNTVVGSSYVLFVLSIFFTIVGLLFAGKVCLPGWGDVPSGDSWGVQSETERIGTPRRAHDRGVVVYAKNSLNCETKQTITAHTTYECSPPPNLCFVKPVLSLCCTFEFQPKGSGGRWSSCRPVRKGQSAFTAAASSTTLLWNKVPLSSVQLSFCSVSHNCAPYLVERKDKKLVENVGTDIMDQALCPTRGAPHVLSSGQRAGRDTALLQKRKKGTVLRKFLLTHYMRRTLQDCRSGPCKAVPRCYTLRYWQTRLWIWHHTKINSRLSSTWVEFGSVTGWCVCAFDFTPAHLLVLISGFAEPFTSLVWFANVP